VTALLPEEIQQVFDRFVTTEYTTIDAKGQPITWPVTPYYEPGGRTIDVTTGLGYPKKANDARTNSRVSLLFSDPTGCGMEGAPMVLVQGTGEVDDRDLDANRNRYERESQEKLPATKEMLPPKPLRKAFSWYFTRLYVKVRPERIFVWPNGDPTEEPQLLDTHMEEVRSGHSEEPEAPHAGPTQQGPAWDERIDELGKRYDSAVLTLVSPDGFPFSLRLPVELDREARRVRLGSGALGVPIQPGLACVTAHDHAPDFSWQRNFQVRGDLVEEDGGWALVPQKLIGGFELPPTSNFARYRLNFSKMMRFRMIAKRELRARAEREGAPGHAQPAA
jgi:hypothetical protein